MPDPDNSFICFLKKSAAGFIILLHFLVGKTDSERSEELGSLNYQEFESKL